MKNFKNGFTLAEVLITLAIIGVVAAMTIPTLIAKINEKVTQNQEAVFRAKMIKGFNLAKTSGDLNNTYKSTYEFLTDGLSKHLKLAKICDKDHIRDCVPYDNINYIKDDKEETFAVNKIKTSHSLNLKEENGFKDSAAFVLGDGTVVIGSYKQDCIVDTEELDKEISSCFDGLYDLNGTRKPNKLGKDIMPIHTAGIDASPAVLATIGGVKIISNAEVPTPLTIFEVYKLINEGIYPIKYPGNSTNNYWASAVKTCQDMGGHLPTEQQLADIATALYGGKKGGGSFSADASDPASYYDTYGAGDIGSGEAIPEPLSGLGSSWYYLWASRDNRGMAFVRQFGKSYTKQYNNYGYYSDNPRAVCVIN